MGPCGDPNGGCAAGASAGRGDVIPLLSPPLPAAAAALPHPVPGGDTALATALTLGLLLASGSRPNGRTLCFMPGLPLPGRSFGAAFPATGCCWLPAACAGALAGLGAAAPVAAPFPATGGADPVPDPGAAGAAAAVAAGALASLLSLPLLLAAAEPARGAEALPPPPAGAGLSPAGTADDGAPEPGRAAGDMVDGLELAALAAAGEGAAVVGTGGLAAGAGLGAATGLRGSRKGSVA